MFKSLLAALVLVSISSVAYSQTAAKPVPVEPAPQALSDIELSGWARPRVIVAPDYPPTAVATKTTGHVDLEVVIAEDGILGEIRSLTSTPKNEEFENAVRDVINLWFFYPAWSECRPTESVGNVRVWFEIKDDKGVVSVSRRKPPPQPERGARKRMVNPEKAAEIRAAVRYPQQARRAGAQGNVHLKVTFDPETGNVTGIDKYARSKPSGYEHKFAEAAIEAIAGLKGDPIPGFGKPFEVCMPFSFRLTN